LPPDRENLGFEIVSRHHHPSVRLAALIAKIKESRSKNPAAAFTPQKLLPFPLYGQSTHRSALNQKRDFRASMKAYTNWLEHFLAPRSSPFRINPLPNFNFGEGRERIPDLSNVQLLPHDFAEFFKYSIERVQNDPNWTRTEKIERVFEILALFSLDSYGWQRTNAVIKFFGVREEQILRNAIRAIAFSESDPWDPDKVLSEFSSRNFLFENGSHYQYPTREVLRQVVLCPLWSNLFRQLRASSKRWEAFLQDVFDYKPDQGAKELLFLLSNVLAHAWLESDLIRFLDKLENQPLDSLYRSEESFVVVWFAFDRLEKFFEQETRSAVEKRLERSVLRIALDYQQRRKSELQRVLARPVKDLTDSQFRSAYLTILSLMSVKQSHKSLELACRFSQV
jgi:hypothetical protein